MPLLLENMQGQGEPGTLEWNGETLEFTYNPNAISYKERKRLRKMILAQQASPENTETDWVIEYVTKMVTAWELYRTKADREKKKPLPITAESLDELPDPFLLALMTRIGELTSPPPIAPSDSGGSFSAAAATNGASVPTGI